jgi:hypothetical protein
MAAPPYKMVLQSLRSVICSKANQGTIQISFHFLKNNIYMFNFFINQGLQLYFS